MPVRVFMSHGRYADKAWWRESDPSDPFDALAEWTECGNAARENIDRYIKSWKSEMDTLLVFGALYSAIVTAFLIDSYKWLQADSSDSTVLLLSKISAQIANPSQSVASLPSFAPTSSQVAINILWFASLILSLTAILLAIMVKQWLSEYSWPAGTVSARQTMAMRQIRVDSLYDWHISTIVDWLPLLLITSVFLFFGGLATLLFTMNTAVAAVTAGFISISVIIFLVTSVLPTFAPDCSYRSIQSFIFFLFFSPIAAFLSGVPTAWEHVTSASKARMTQVEPRALIWLLMNLCPWRPSLYPTVSACARSLSRTMAPRAVCDLFRVSISHEDVKFTREQARRWQLRIGANEFERTCLLLATGAETMSNEDWTDVDADDITDYVKTLSLFYSLFTPEYLKSGGSYYEEYPTEVFRKGLEIMVKIVIGDNLPKQLPESRQKELRGFVREQLYVMNDFEWPQGNFSEITKIDYVSALLPTVVEAAVRSQPGKTSESDDFLFLSTFALGMTRRMTHEQMRKNQDSLISLLNAMSEFISIHTGGTDVTVPRRAISRWIPTWFTPYSSSRSRNRHVTGVAIGNWNTSEQSIQHAVGELLGSLSRAQSLDHELWSDQKMHRDRLRMGFGDSKVLCEAYVDSAAYISKAKDPWSKEHQKRWNDALTEVESERLVHVLWNACKTEPSVVYVRVLCQVLPAVKNQFSLSDDCLVLLLETFRSATDANVLTHIANCVSGIIADGQTRYRTDYSKVSMRLQKVLAIALNVTPSNEANKQALATILGSTLDPLSRIDNTEFPGVSKLRAHALSLVRRLQDLMPSGTQNMGHDASHYKLTVNQWMKYLEHAVDNQGTIFFTVTGKASEAEREVLVHEVRAFLELLEREALLTEPESAATFRKIREWFPLD